MTLFSIYSKAAGLARALITLLSAVLVFITASGVVDQPVVAKISAAVVAAIQLLTRFTGLGDVPPKLAPDVGGDLKEDPHGPDLKPANPNQP